MVRDQRDQRLQKIESKSNWFLHSCASRHLCNNPSLFTNKRDKSINFITAAGQIIRIEEISTVSIPLADGSKIKLQNVALAPEYDSNLITLGQLRETRITFHANSTAMILIKNRKIIAQTKKDRNLFIFELT